MAHLPTLATQIMHDMDVESLISRLQQARAPRQPLAQPILAPPRLPDPPPSNVSTSAGQETSSNVAKSWVEQFSASSDQSLSLSAGDVATTSADRSLSLPTHSLPPTTETDVDARSESRGDAQMSESLMSVPETSSQASGSSSSADKDSAVMVNLDYAPTPLAESFPPPPPLSAKEKLALWKELMVLRSPSSRIKIQTKAASFSRRPHTRTSHSSSSSSDAGGEMDLHDEGDTGMKMVDGGIRLAEADCLDAMGWRGIGERVREAVGEVFDGALVEGDPRLFVLDFDPLPAILPISPAQISTTLASGGLTSSLAHVDPALSTLLDASHAHIGSADFGLALRKCLDFGVKAMRDGLVRSGEFGEAAATASASNTVGEEGEKVKLAALLPGVARWTHLALNGVPNEIIEGFAELREVAGYSAIVLSSFEGAGANSGW
ncbi:peroxisomal biogenesis factor 3 [Ceratobasidium sp. AG-Ba]|nr:peroxisomal biogenesis factor 3 [Ceratobasidium sp. AG-Ba]